MDASPPPKPRVLVDGGPTLVLFLATSVLTLVVASGGFIASAYTAAFVRDHRTALAAGAPAAGAPAARALAYDPCLGAYDFSGTYAVTQDVFVHHGDAWTQGRVTQQYSFSPQPAAGANAWTIRKGPSGTNLVLGVAAPDPNEGPVDSMCFAAPLPTSTGASMLCVDVADAGTVELLVTEVEASSCRVTRMMNVYTEPHAADSCGDAVCRPNVGAGTLHRIGAYEDGPRLSVDRPAHPDPVVDACSPSLSWAGVFAQSSAGIAFNSTAGAVAADGAGLAGPGPGAIAVRPFHTNAYHLSSWIITSPSADEPLALCIGTAERAMLRCVSVRDASTHTYHATSADAQCVVGAADGLSTRPKVIGAPGEAGAAAETLARHGAARAAAATPASAASACAPGGVDFAGTWNRTLTAMRYADGGGAAPRVTVSLNKSKTVHLSRRGTGPLYVLAKGDVSAGFAAAGLGPGQPGDPGRFGRDALCSSLRSSSASLAMLECADVGDLGTTVLMSTAVDDQCRATEAHAFYLEPFQPGGCGAVSPAACTPNISYGIYRRLQ